MAPTSYPMALAALIPLPFDIVFTVLRFWIRTKRNAWGPDDWAMLVNIVSAVDFHGLVALLTLTCLAILVCQYDSYHCYGVEWDWEE
jgi:hypothetical protein